MGKITDIQIQKKNKDRVSIFIDGDFYSGMDLFTKEKHRLKIGSEVDEKILAVAVFESECNSAFEKSLSQINARMRTQKEILTYLKGKEYSNEIIDSTVQKLIDYKYIDDTEFCRLYIEAHKGKWGIKKIEFMLKGLGADRYAIDDAMAEFSETGPQDDTAYNLLIKYKKQKPLDKNKAYMHLAQKGFSSDTIKMAIAKVLSEENE